MEGIRRDDEAIEKLVEPTRASYIREHHSAR